MTPTVRAGWSRRLALAAAVCVSGTILMRQSAAQAGDIYLPVAIQSGAPTALAIWAAGSAPGAADHQVVLFRTSIEVEPDAAGTGQLAIIADTRYEVFLDGAFVGRGPARFSASLHEYDVLAVELPAGSHWLAVAVQWAPNRRRSESGHPYLLATVRSPGGRLLAATGPDWEALATDAYRPSVQVHADGMIGPAEILDTTRLPPAWRAPSPPVATFPRASIVPRPAGLFRVRSIPPLQTTRLTPALLDSGRLSPGRVMLQAPGSHHVHLDSAASVELETVAPAVRAAINGVPVAWAPEPGRLDVLRATVRLDAGHHELAMADEGPVAVGGAAGGLSTVSQGRHAGRRLLLAAHVSGDGAAVATGVDGLSIRLDAGAYVVLDLGRTVHGRLVATARADQRGVLDAGWSERLLNGRPLPHPGSLQPEWSQVDSWILSADQAASVTTIDARAGRYLLLAAWEGAVQLEALAVEEETYLTEPIGRFTSSDPLLDRIWRTGADTLRVNMTDGYADPWRERGQWWGDAYVAIQVNRAVYGDAFLWRRGLEAMARAHTDGRPPAAAPSPPADTVLLDYGLLWLISMQEYRQATGDSSLAVGYQDVVADALRYYATWEAPDSGLLELPPGPWQSKALVDWAGQFDREGEITALNAQYSAALDAAASLAYATGQDALVRQRRGRAGEVRRAIVDRLWDPAGRFFYTARVSDDFVPPWPHAQAWALAYQVPYDPDRAATADALLNLVSRDPAHANVEIYGFQWLLEGLAADDRLAEAADLVRTHYGAVLDAGHTTWPEVFDPSPRWSWSLSHAWGASPTWFLTTHVLGARQQGSRSWWIQPAFDVVSHAEGVLPLIANMPGRDLSPASNAPAHSPPDLLTVSWTGGSCSARTLSYEAPARTTGAIALISAQGSTVTLDGQEVWAGGAALVPGAWAGSGSSVILYGREGAHTVGVSAPEGGCP